MILTFICDNCDAKVDSAGYFSFNSSMTDVIWKGHLCQPCQVSLVNGKPLRKFGVKQN